MSQVSRHENNKKENLFHLVRQDSRVILSVSVSIFQSHKGRMRMDKYGKSVRKLDFTSTDFFFWSDSKTERKEIEP